ncbi:MAG: MFS transporter [Bryobacteraceae bacterium]|jgi:MFS family permease
MSPAGVATTERPTRVRYWVIVFAVTLAIITYIDRVSISYAALFIRRDLHLSSDQMGWAFGAFGLAYALFEMPGGYLGDRLGPRSVLLRIVLWWSFFTAATGRAWNLVSITTTQFLFGAGEAGCFPNLTKAFTTWLPAREKVRAQGIMWLSARWGGAFTPPLVALVMGFVGWRNAFALFGLVGVLWAVLFYRWYRNDPRDNARLNDAERRLLSQSATLATGHGDVPWGKLVRSRQVWMLCWQYFSLSYGWYFYITWLPTYLREARHLQMSSTAWFGILPLFFGGLGNPASVVAGGWLRRRNVSVTWARRIMASLGFAGAASFLVFSTTRTDALPATLSIAMASFCNDLVMPCAWGAAMDVGGKFAGTLSGAMNMWGNFAGFVAPVVIGYLLRWTHSDWNLTFYVSAGVYLTGIIFWMLLDPVTPIER